MSNAELRRQLELLLSMSPEPKVPVSGSGLTMLPDEDCLRMIHAGKLVVISRDKAKEIIAHLTDI